MPGCCHEIPGRRLPEGSARRPPGCGFGGVGEGDAKRKQKKRKKKKKSRGAMPGCCHEIPGRRLPEGSARRPPGCGFGGVGEGDAKRKQKKRKNKKKAGVPSHPVERLVPTYTTNSRRLTTKTAAAVTTTRNALANGARCRAPRAWRPGTASVIAPPGFTCLQRRSLAMALGAWGYCPIRRKLSPARPGRSCKSPAREPRTPCTARVPWRTSARPPWTRAR